MRLRSNHDKVTRLHKSSIIHVVGINFYLYVIFIFLFIFSVYLKKLLVKSLHDLPKSVKTCVPSITTLIKYVYISEWAKNTIFRIVKAPESCWSILKGSHFSSWSLSYLKNMTMKELRTRQANIYNCKCQHTSHGNQLMLNEVNGNNALK